MNKEQVLEWLGHFVERIEEDPASGKWRLHGPISSREKQALEHALTMLSIAEIGDDEMSKATSTNTESGERNPLSTRTGDAEKGFREEPAEIAAPALPNVTLDVRSLEISAPENPEVTLCLDFGTAMSKAFAMHGHTRPLELALGKRAGATGYAVDSSLFIADNSTLYFGPQAVDLDGVVLL